MSSKNVLSPLRGLVERALIAGLLQNRKGWGRHLLLTTVLMFAVAQVSTATTYYWRGISGSWGIASNWSLTSGGPADGAVPGINDIAVFDTGSSTCTLVVATTIRGLIIGTAMPYTPYTGTINLNGKNLVVNALAATDISISGGNVSNPLILPGPPTSLSINTNFEVTIRGLTTAASFPMTSNTPSFLVTLNTAGTPTGITISSCTFNGNFLATAPDNINLSSGNTFGNNTFSTTTKITKISPLPPVNYSFRGFTTGTPANVFGTLTTVIIENNSPDVFTYSRDTYNCNLTVSNRAGATGTLKVDSITANKNFNVLPNSTGALNVCRTGDCLVGGNLLVQSNAGGVGVFTFGDSGSPGTSGTVQFIGSSPQTIGIVSPNVASLAFTKLALNKSAVATITANTDVEVKYSATMTNGIVAMGLGKKITFKDPPSVNGYSPSSFVDGLVEYSSASGTVTFPTGKAPGLIYRPVSIIFSGSEPTLSNINAQYFNSQAPSYLSLNGLASVSLGEYWTVNASPSQNFNAVLSWKNADTNNPNYVVDETTLRVSNFIAGQWQNNGGTASGPSLPVAGTITSNAINPSGNIGNLTLGSTSAANELRDGPYRWRNTTGNNQWNTAANWDSNKVPTALNVVIFDGGGVSGNTNCILPGIPVTIGGLISTSAYTSTINLTGSPLTVDAVAPVALNGGNFISGSLVLNGTVSAIGISGVTAALGTQVTVSGNAVSIGSSTFNGSLTANSPTIIGLTGNVTIGQLTFSAALDLNGSSLTINGNSTDNLTGGSITNSGSVNSVFFTDPGAGVNITGTTFGAKVNLKANVNGAMLTGGAIFNGSIDITANSISIGNIKLGGDLTLNNLGGTVSASTLEFIGGFTQTITSTNNLVNVTNLILNKTGAAQVICDPTISNDLILPRGIRVYNSATFTNGIIKGAVIFRSSATATGMSNFSYVDGHVSFAGTSAFTYPVGGGPVNPVTGGSYRPVTISTATVGKSDMGVQYHLGGITPDTGPGTMTGPLKNISMCEYWDITKSGGVGFAQNVTLTFPWTYSYCGNSVYIGDTPSLVVAHHYLPPTLQWHVEGAPSLTITTPGVGGTITSGPYMQGNDIEYFTLGSTNPAFMNPLPIQLTDFSGRLTSQGVSLHWQTASELNNDHFEIQRSANGIDFTKIGEVDGHGTTSIEHKYSFLDSDPLAGLSYYRLRQVDSDGQSTYSDIVSISNFESALRELSVYPNPTASTLFLSQKASDVKIVDVLGRVVFIGHDIDEVNVGGLSPGFYYLVTPSSQAVHFIKK